MPPYVLVILNLILDYIANNADEIVKAIKDKFLTSKTVPAVVSAIQEFGYAPSGENLEKLHTVLKENGEDADQLAKILINSATV
ncbi:MAG: hypothetical protein IPP74_14790 [Alphaproteobacteria bacterium]|nr:hypothetical protein [Alphaproteobacteria bacterium]